MWHEGLLFKLEHIGTSGRQVSLKVFKVGLSLSKKICVICFTESPLKNEKRFFFHLESSFRSQDIRSLFGHVGKKIWLER